MKGTFIIIVTFCLFILPSAVFACFCVTGEPSFEFDQAKSVFIGRVLGGTEKLTAQDELGKTRELEAGQIRFAVQELFKGDIPNEIVVYIDSMKGTSCGDYGLERGEVYVVYVYESKKTQELYSGVCTRTSLISSKDAEEDVKFLRNLPSVGQESIDAKQTEWIAKSLKEIETIKVNMTRRDLMRVFTEEGGLSTRLYQNFVYRRCPFIKVHVEFRAAGRTSKDKDGRFRALSDERDLIKSISKPFLEWSIGD
jgi:hypothetical protein